MNLRIYKKPIRKKIKIDVEKKTLIINIPYKYFIKVQELLFRHRCKWKSGSKKPIKPEEFKDHYIIINNKKMLYDYMYLYESNKVQQKDYNIIEFKDIEHVL